MCPFGGVLTIGLILSSWVMSAFADAAMSSAASTITAAPSAQPSLEPQYYSESVFTSAVLNSTNFFRAEHGAQPLSWNASLESYAANYLDNSGCNFAHSGGPNGENLAEGYVDVTDAIDGWGDERSEYDYANPGFSEQTGHFTQLVWKNTSTVGCARMYCASAGIGWYLVCEYSPRGNIIGYFAQQVDKQNNGPPQQVSLGTPGPTAEGDGGVQPNGGGGGGGGGCPQGAACDSGNILSAPWWLKRSYEGTLALAVYLGLWAWI